MPVAAKSRSRSSSPSAAQTQTHLDHVSKLRQKMHRQLNKSVSETDVRLGTAAHADKVKQRSLYIERLIKDTKDRMARTASIRITLRRCMTDVRQQNGAVTASLGVCDKRIELRSERPPKELCREDFDEVLSEEREVYTAIQVDLNQQLQTGKVFVKPLEEVKKDLQAALLTVHFDRDGSTEKLVNKATKLIETAEQYCKETHVMLRDVKERIQCVSETTRGIMKEHIAETFKLRWKVESEMTETAKTIIAAEAYLEKTERQLRIELAMPERNMDFGGDGKNEELSAKTGVLATLRAKIKSASYTGPGGRNWEVTFARFDKDRSGELDEDEVRIAVRKACKIPPSVITDAEISALCELLDEDGSGAISIAELVDFLLADTDPEHLQDEIKATRETLDGLKAAQEDILIDLKDKISLWRINEACSKVTPVKGLGLDGSPSIIKGKKKGGSRGPLASRMSELLRDAVDSAKLLTAMSEAKIEMDTTQLIKADGAHTGTEAAGALDMEEATSAACRTTDDAVLLPAEPLSYVAAEPYITDRMTGDAALPTAEPYINIRMAASGALDSATPSCASRGTTTGPRKPRNASTSRRRRSGNRALSQDERCMLRSMKKDEQVRKLLQSVMKDGLIDGPDGPQQASIKPTSDPSISYVMGSYWRSRTNIMETFLNGEERDEVTMYLDDSDQKRHRRYGHWDSAPRADEQKRQRFVDVLMKDDASLRKRLQQALLAGSAMQA